MFSFYLTTKHIKHTYPSTITQMPHQLHQISNTLLRTQIHRFEFQPIAAVQNILKHIRECSHLARWLPLCTAITLSIINYFFSVGLSIWCGYKATETTSISFIPANTFIWVGGHYHKVVRPRGDGRDIGSTSRSIKIIFNFVWSLRATAAWTRDVPNGGRRVQIRWRRWFPKWARDAFD